MRLLYTLLTYLLRPIAFAVVLGRGLRNRRYWDSLGERFGAGGGMGAGDSGGGNASAGGGSGASRRGRAGGGTGTAPALWVHAVSLGEMTAAAPLVHALRVRYPEMPCVVTTATPTGRARAAALFGDRVAIRFLPYDTPGSMRRFLAGVNPRLAIIMETELWPNVFHQCGRRGIPIVLANARLSPKSVARYQRFGPLFRRAVGGATIAAQSSDDAQRFLALGAQPERTRVIGNLKFDVAVDAGSAARGRALRAGSWPERPVWIAGSTHPGEEDLALTVHARLQSDLPAALLLLVPRHPERFAAVADLLNRRGVRFQRRSSNDVVRADCSVLLVDSVGELASLYAAVDAAFVGGSLVPVGGHNLLEAAALGVPVLTGPYQSNARDVAQLLLREGAALQVADALEFYRQLRALLMDEAWRRQMGGQGLRVVAENRGSVMRLLDLIDPLLADPSAAR